MSLINKALKKAQHQRANESMANLASPERQSRGVRQPGLHPAMLIMVTLVAALLIGLVAGGVVYLLVDQPDQVASERIDAPSVAAPEMPTREGLPSPTAPEHTPPPTTPITPASTKAAPATSAPTPAPEQATPPSAKAPAPPTASPAAPASTAVGKTAATQPTTVSNNVQNTERPTPNLKEGDADPVIVRWLTFAKATGVRIAGPDSKVLINGRAYEINDTVHIGLKLRVIAIQSEKLLFEDGNGTRYIKRI